MMKRFYFLLCVLVFTLAGCAQPISPESLTPAQTQAKAKKTLETLLKLTDSIKQPEDLSTAHFEQVTGYRLRLDKDDAEESFLREFIGNGWLRDFTIRRTTGATYPVIYFEFFNLNKPKNQREKSKQSNICSPDADQFKQQLINQGYVFRTYLDNNPYRQLYSRNAIRLDLILNEDKSLAKNQKCVSEIEISYTTYRFK